MFGPLWCSLWLAIDVWLCTASILNLCAISLDRYLAISRPFKYRDLMTPTRGKVLVGLVWALSFIICIPPLLGWNETKTDIVESIKDRSKGGTIDYSVMDYNTTQSVPSYGNTSELVTPTTFACQPVSYPTCELTADPGYIIYSALGSFFIPAIIMSFFYYKIYRTAARATAALQKGMLTTRTGSDVPSLCSEDDSVTLRIHRGGGGMSSNTSKPSKRASSLHSEHDSITPLRSPIRTDSDQRNPRKFKGCMRSTSLDSGTCFMKNTTEQIPRTDCDSLLLKHFNSNNDNSLVSQVNNSSKSQQEPKSPSSKSINDFPELRHKGDQNKPKRKNGRNSIRVHLRKLNKEKKAAKTVGIIVGGFILCWMPFFTIYLLGAFGVDGTHPLVFSIFFWLGYCNSALNPCIYALFSRDFRYAFRNILVCKCKRQSFKFWRFHYTLRISSINSKSSESNSE